MEPDRTLVILEALSDTPQTAAEVVGALDRAGVRWPAIDGRDIAPALWGLVRRKLVDKDFAPSMNRTVYRLTPAGVAERDRLRAEGGGAS
jgi:DNA-binding PadR family transcriptional regulator